VFENEVLLRIFGPEREDAREGSRKLHNGVLHNFCFSINIDRIIE
jgi:hypothetical protein